MSIRSYAYDNQGNVAGRGTQTYHFDEGNRLTQAPGIASYTYDGLGRRTSITAATGINRIQIYDSAGQLLYGVQQQRGTTQTTRYVYMGKLAIAETNSVSGTAFLHTDALGSPVATSNASGSLLTLTRYEAYGATAAGTNPDGLGFTGHVNDPSTGLVYMQQRYYDPIAARFFSVDPIVTDTSTGESFNRYEYVHSNPYRFTDPNGESSEDVLNTIDDILISNPEFGGPLISEGIHGLASPNKLCPGSGDSGRGYGAGRHGGQRSTCHCGRSTGGGRQRRSDQRTGDQSG